jgi:hypothetical protein
MLKRVARIKKHMRKPTYNLLVDLKGIWDSRTMNALPNSWNDGIRAINADDMGVLEQPRATRSVDWLQETGKCIDHILPGNSTIEGAGHGAFAKRNLPAGTIITGTPLHHVPNRRVFNIYDVEDGERKDGEFDLPSDSVIGQQVMLNYCFGHAESTLLLCPYSSGIGYFNHNKTLANVKIEWARHGSTSHNANWLSIPPEEMEWQYRTNLAFDFIATRDIAQGEELFIDYGEDWEEAWLDHVHNWDYSDRANRYKSATQYNAMFGDSPVRTADEQEKNPYPENISIRCHSYLLSKRYASGEKDSESMKWNNNHKGYRCKILRRHDAEGTYDVSVRYKRKDITRDRVRREALSFADVPYSTDMHLPRAFRHHMVIPDGLMPEAWKNARME